MGLCLYCVIPSNLLYKSHQIPKLKCFSSRLAVVFVQSIEARCQVKHEDVVGATPTGDAPTTSEWSAILLLTKVWLILEVWWKYLHWCWKTHAWDVFQLLNGRLHTARSMIHMWCIHKYNCMDDYRHHYIITEAYNIWYYSNCCQWVYNYLECLLTLNSLAPRRSGSKF